MSIRKRSERSHQVRVAPFPAKTFPTRATAKAYELELLTRRAQGDAGAGGHVGRDDPPRISASRQPFGQTSRPV